MRPSSAHSMSSANASSLLSSSSASQLLSGGRPFPAPASGAIQPTCKVGRVVKHKPRLSRRPPPIYLTATPANFAHIVQEATGCPVPASSSIRRQATASASQPSYLPPPPTTSMLLTLDTPMFLPDHVVPALARGPEDKSSSGGASLTVAATSATREGWLLQELHAMTSVPDFLSDDFPNLESWGII